MGGAASSRGLVDAQRDDAVPHPCEVERSSSEVNRKEFNPFGVLRASWLNFSNLASGRSLAKSTG